MDALKKLQDKLLQKALPLPQALVEAYYKYPRHLFVPEYTQMAAYSDHPLLIYDRYPFVSTISQPTFVLQILNELKIESGQRVFELGTGSGWNAALMASLVGPSGLVITTEVIPEVAERAKKTLEELGVDRARVITGDGFEGAPEFAPFDRIIFTAGSSEFPHKLFGQLRDGGLMAFVRQREFNSDLLEILQKEGDHWKVLTATPCSFVSVIRKTEPPKEGGSLSW